MKNIITILFIFFNVTFSNAQDDCETYIDFMTEAVEQKDIKKAISDMKAYIACNEENLGKENFILKNMESISYILDKKEDKYIVKLKDENIAILDEKFNSIFTFQDKNLKYINYTEGYIRMFKWDAVENFRYFLYDLQGKVINKIGFNYLDNFCDDYALFRESSGKMGDFNRTGYVDKNGSLNYLDKYFEVYPYRSNVAIVELRNDRNKFNFIDKDFNEILKKPIELSLFTPFYDNIAFIVFENGKRATIDTSGSIKYIPKNVEIISPFSNNVAIAKSNNKLGLIDKDFNEITGFIYDNIKNDSFFLKPVSDCLADWCRIMSKYYGWTSREFIVRKKVELNFDFFEVTKDNKSLKIDKQGDIVN